MSFGPKLPECILQAVRGGAGWLLPLGGALAMPRGGTTRGWKRRSPPGASSTDVHFGFSTESRQVMLGTAGERQHAAREAGCLLKVSPSCSQKASGSRCPPVTVTRGLSLQEQKDPDPKHPPPPAVGGKQRHAPVPPPPEAGPPQKHPTAPPPSRSTSLRCQGTWSAQSPSVAFPVSPVGRQRVNWAPSPTCLGLAALSRGAWRGAGWVKVALQAGGDVLRMAPSARDPTG